MEPTTGKTLETAPGTPGRAGFGGAGFRLLAFLSIRRGEGVRALLTFTYLFLVIGAYLLIKAIRNSLFISEFGAVKLPYVMLGIALLAGIFSSFYIRLARRFPIQRLIVGTLLFFCSNILLFWWLALREYTWLYPVIYIWAGVYGVVATSQVWMLANELFTTREAKRLFGFIGAGGILGGLAGASLAPLLAHRIGTTNLLLAVAGFLLLAAAAVSLLNRYRPVRRSTPEEAAAPQNLTESLKRIHRSRHLRYLAALVFVTAVATSTADLQFNIVADESIDGRDALTAFFGFWYGVIQILSVALQLFFTSRLLKHLGVGLSLCILPLSLISSSIILLSTRIIPLLFTAHPWPAILLKSSDGAFKHSVDRSSREMMYLPLPILTKIHSKLTIDSVMDRAGDGTAGIVQLVVVTFLGLGLIGSLLTNFAALGIWLLLAILLKKQYVHSLRDTMGSTRLQVPAAAVAMEDADARRVLEQLLREGDETQKLGALEWLAEQSGQVEERILLELARDDDSPAVRRQSLAVLLGGNASEMPVDLAASLEGEGQAALVSVIDLMMEPGESGVHEKLESLLDGVEETARLPLVAFTVRRLGSELEPFARRIFDALLAPETPARTRCAAARTLALLPADSPLQDLLAPLLDDADPAVAAAAAECAGRLQRIDLAPSLVGLLGNSRTRSGAKRGIGLLGTSAIDELIEALQDPRLPDAVRRQIPALLARIGTSKAISALVSGLEDSDAAVRDRSIRALCSVRWRLPEVHPVPGGKLQRLVLAECDAYEQLLRSAGMLRGTTVERSPAGEILADSLEELRLRNVERIFRLLALEYNFADMERARRALGSGSSRDRSNTLEFLDNILPRAMKRRLIPLVESSADGDPGVRMTAAGGATRLEVLRSLAEIDDPWVRACTLHLAGVEGIRGLEDAARLARNSEDPALREEGTRLLERLP